MAGTTAVEGERILQMKLVDSYGCEVGDGDGVVCAAHDEVVGVESNQGAEGFEGHVVLGGAGDGGGEEVAPADVGFAVVDKERGSAYGVGDCGACPDRVFVDNIQVCRVVAGAQNEHLV